MIDDSVETQINFADMSVNIAGVNFRNPVIAASGTFTAQNEFASSDTYGEHKTAASQASDIYNEVSITANSVFEKKECKSNLCGYSKIIDVSLLGGICTKGLTMTPREGNSGIRIWETPSGLLNSIGLENKGIVSFLENDLPQLINLGPVIIANLSGGDSNEYVKGASLLNESPVHMIELNISCPNVKAGGMMFGLDPGTAAALVAAVRRVCTHKPLIVKLSPNCPSLSSVALACIRAGADAFSLVNTIKAMAIDIINRKPVFDYITAGLSGPAIKPIAIRMVWELIDALRDAKLQTPIIGIGGIADTNDALEFLMAGASAIQVGSATFVNPHTMINIINGLHDYMINNNMSKLSYISIRDK